jgi:hypothetical protein
MDSFYAGAFPTVIVHYLNKKDIEFLEVTVKLISLTHFKPHSIWIFCQIVMCFRIHEIYSKIQTVT